MATAKLPRLDSLQDIRGVQNALRKVYRQAQRQQITTQDAQRLASVLKTLADTMVAVDLEGRIEAIEQGTPPPRPISKTNYLKSVG